ncbi:MAG: cupin domain-containing protein [bacterium]
MTDGKLAESLLGKESNSNMIPDTQPIILFPEKGRRYACGPMTAVFKADDIETGDRYSVSEWTVAPHSPGSGPHSHESNEELFLVTDGTMAIRVGDQWIDAPRGTFVRIPAGVVHDFENRTDHAATLFNVFLPGGFEPMMPAIVSWFAEKGTK